MKFKYILTTKDFFKKGPCGRVSHARGFIEGLLSNKQVVTLASTNGADKFIAENDYLNIKTVDKMPLLYSAIEIIKSIINKEKIIIRWRPILPFLYFPLMVAYKDINYEINSITGLDSKNIIIRELVKLSISLVSKYSKIIVVSEHSKRQVLSISCDAKSIYVMPNGIITDSLITYKPKINKSAEKNLVYFGRKQDYYEWDNLYEFCKENENINLHIFGFTELLSIVNIRFYGEFDHLGLIEKLNNIVNPILIIHPDDSDIAKSGSPMKLFEYAYLSIPVIVGDSLLEVSKDFPEFIFYESGNKLSLDHAIRNTVANYNDIYTNFSHLKDTVITKYSWEAIIKKWLEAEAK